MNAQHTDHACARTWPPSANQISAIYHLSYRRQTVVGLWCVDGTNWPVIFTKSARTPEMTTCGCIGTRLPADKYSKIRCMNWAMDVSSLIINHTLTFSLRPATTSGAMESTPNGTSASAGHRPKPSWRGFARKPEKSHGQVEIRKHRDSGSNQGPRGCKAAHCAITCSPVCFLAAYQTKLDSSAGCTGVLWRCFTA